MVSLNFLMLFAGILVLLGILSSKFSARLGMPVLVMFLGVGMLAGSEGLGGVVFEDYALANSLGSAALALILFDGGLQTSSSSLRVAWKPALSLATIGVLVTAVVTGAAAAWILGVPMLYGMLLGGIVGSTDAAAVFAVLRSSGVRLRENMSATLEVESASNDPMAIFLTVGIIELITGGANSIASLVPLFLVQFGVGSVIGGAVGWVAAWVINKVHLDTPGLYPILVTAFALCSFGLAAVIGGSGFLAVYLTGIVIGNSNIVFRRGIHLFHDAGAWLSQIVLFVMLGLLSFPSRLIAAAGDGLLVSIVLIFLARPIAVAISAAPFKFNLREFTFISWVGLKGAVPITLATFPLMAGVTGSDIIFDVVFFIVLISALTQGWSLPVVAKWLGLAKPLEPSPALSVEINSLRHVDGDIVDYTVAPSARVTGQLLRDLALPDGVVVTLVVRGDEVIMPRGATALRPGDHVFVAMRKRLKPVVDRLFDPNAETPPLEPGLALDFRRNATIGQLHRFFGIPGPTWSTEPISVLLDRAGEDQPPRLGPFLVSPADDPEYARLTFAPTEEHPAEPEPIGLAVNDEAEPGPQVSGHP